MDYQSFEIEFVESIGALFSVCSPTLFCRVAGLGQDANLVILAYDYSQKKWDEYRNEVTPDESEGIVILLKRLGIPERLLEVKGMPDTSDSWGNLSLKIKFDDKRFYLDITTQLSGYMGKDAQNLHELFQYLFSIAGYSRGYR